VGKWQFISHLTLESRGTRLYAQRRLLTQRSSFRHSGTAIAVARIFLTASRKFPSFSISGRPPAEKLAQPDRMSLCNGMGRAGFYLLAQTLSTLLVIR
jgi:hypothetical protein